MLSREELGPITKKAREKVQPRLSQKAMGEQLGISKSTVNRWEGGKEIKLTPLAIATMVAEVTGYPREALGLPPAPSADRSTERRLGVMEIQMRELLRQLGDKELIEIRELKEASAGVAQQYRPSSEPREEPESGAENE